MKKIFYIVLFLFILLLFEISSWLIGKYIQKHFGIFYAPDISKIDYLTYISKRDNILGWPDPLSFGKDGKRDKTGSRIVPAFPDPDRYKTCISLYGDSFTWGWGVDNEHAWGNILAKMINCRVANYGVSGYGTDQAYLRFKMNTKDDSSIVILGHLSDDIQRNVTQFFELMGPIRDVGTSFKPRFILENGKLKLIPLLNFSSEKEYRETILYPEKYLKYDYFIPGGKSGTIRLKFPYLWSIFKALLINERLHMRLLGRPAAFNFYKPDHPSKALQITVEIIKSFHREAIRRKKEPIVIIFPGIRDLIFFKKNKIWVYQSLIDKLDENGIRFLNLGNGIIDYLNNRSPQEIFFQKGVEVGHFNDEGNRVIATIVFNFIKQNNLLSNKKDINVAGN